MDITSILFTAGNNTALLNQATLKLDNYEINLIVFLYYSQRLNNDISEMVFVYSKNMYCFVKMSVLKFLY